METARKNPQISVVIPCYNQEKFLSEAIGSVRRQTFRDLEIIVVDDGSTDTEMKRILKDIARNYSGIKIIYQENRGVAAARNAGVRAACGKYFLPLDADDTIESTMLAKCLRVLEGDNKLGFAYTWVRFFGDYEAIWKTREYNFFSLLFENQLTASALVRKSAWEDVGGYDETMRTGHEDWSFWINLGQHGWHGKLVREPLFNYRRHGKSLSDITRPRHHENFAYIQKKHADLYTPESIQRIKSRWGTGPAETLKEKLEITGLLSWRNWLSHPFGTIKKAATIAAKKLRSVKSK